MFRLIVRRHSCLEPFMLYRLKTSFALHFFYYEKQHKAEDASTQSSTSQFSFELHMKSKDARIPLAPLHFKKCACFVSVSLQLLRHMWSTEPVTSGLRWHLGKEMLQENYMGPFYPNNNPLRFPASFEMQVMRSTFLRIHAFSNATAWTDKGV